MPKKLRLDQLLVGKGLFPSREQARRAVMAGDVKVGTRIAVKPSELLEEQAPISIKPTPKYVGRGALKLENALDYFKTDVRGKTALELRNDPRVIVLEKINARSLSRRQVPEPVDLCVIDVSFISLTLILPNAFDLITPTGVILALIKPQFELQRADVGRGGIVREPDLHRKAQEKIVAFVTDSGHVVTGIVPSAIKGADGNQEFFACIRKRSA